VATCDRLITEFVEEFIQTALNSSSPYSQSKVGLMVQILQGILQFDESQVLHLGRLLSFA
jgi:flagellar biosynthesis protein FliQ